MMLPSAFRASSVAPVQMVICRVLFAVAPECKLAARPVQVIKAVLKDADDKTELALVYANQTPDDILLFDELQALAADPRLHIHYTGAHPQPEPSSRASPVSQCGALVAIRREDDHCTTWRALHAWLAHSSRLFAHSRVGTLQTWSLMCSGRCMSSVQSLHQCTVC